MPFESSPAPLADINEFEKISVSESESAVVVSGKGFEVSVTKAEGLLSSYKLNGKEVVAAPLASNFWRAPIDNDNGGGMPRRQGIWKDAGKARTVTNITVNEINDKMVKIAIEMTLDNINSSLSTSYTIYGNGEVVVNYDFVAGGGLPNVPRIGMQMQIANEYDDMKWFGNGPYETYWDRHLGSPVGVYEKSVSKDFYQYVRPQESNNHWGNPMGTTD